MLSFTNKAIVNVKRRLMKMGKKKDYVNNICFTFDKYFCEWNVGAIDSIKDKTLFIEECSMVPNKWMTLIYKAYTMFNIKVFMFADPNQCVPVEPGSQINYDYLTSEAINEMCGKVETLQYIEKTCRYDKQTHNMLSTFLKHGKVSAHFQAIDKKLYKNICYLNSTRIKVNPECCNQFTKGKRYVTIDFKYDNKKETYRVCKNMPILATDNIKDKEIFNTMEFVIEDIKDNKHKVNNEWFDQKVFHESFIPRFCVTVYKYQGADIKEPYNVYDVNRMDKNNYTQL